MKKYITLLLLFIQNIVVYAQPTQIDRVEPLNWWVGMKNPMVQVVVHGIDIALNTVSVNYPGVKLQKINTTDNPNYLFLDLNISTVAKAGKIPFVFSKNGQKQFEYLYEIKPRNSGTKAQGVTDKDFVYLIMPDRFANGDKSNDVVSSLRESALNRDSMYYRHGGDIQGIIDRLDYLQELGVTTLWLNPVLENDQPKTSYHGYANTENYQIDARFGTNELYKKLADECHKRGMKMIKDLVHNHIGNQHWTMLDLPTKDWVHQWPKYTKTNYREQVWMDPYAAQSDKKIMTDGWFDTHMPDMNQNNPFVKNYITQSHIWWEEYARMPAIRSMPKVRILAVLPWLIIV